MPSAHRLQAHHRHRRPLPSQAFFADGALVALVAIRCASSGSPSFIGRDGKNPIHDRCTRKALLKLRYDLVRHARPVTDSCPVHPRGQSALNRYARTLSSWMFPYSSFTLVLPGLTSAPAQANHKKKPPYLELPELRRTPPLKLQAKRVTTDPKPTPREGNVLRHTRRDEISDNTARKNALRHVEKLMDKRNDSAPA